MNPAFSVIVFTTLSGAGFGLWFWLGLRMAFGRGPELYEGLGWMLGLLLGGALAAAGLFASFWHLGKPLRAWRAFSQWRTSWLSREGLLAVGCFAPAAFLLVATNASGHGLAVRIAAAALSAGCIAVVVATAMIYACLAPIPAWRHRLVVPAYLLFAAYTGGLLYGLCATTGPATRTALCAGAPLAAAALWAVKRRYWRDIDRAPLPHTRGDALGLPGRDATTFERPHTEGNYLTREMGFVVARRHAAKLRTVAVALFALLPSACLLPALLLPQAPLAPLLAAAAASALLGAMVERWLFFAQARHLVTLYY